MTPPSKLNERGPAKAIRVKVNQLIEYTKSLRPAKGPNETVKHTQLGTIRIPAAERETVDGGSEIQRFKITTIADDWVVCRKVDKDGAETSSTDFKVMRPIKLRKDQALPTDFKAGTLTNSTSQARTFDRTIGTTDYTVGQEISPPYAVDDLIYGVNKVKGGTVDDASGNQLQWIDLNVDGRHWQYAMREIEVCVSNAIKKAIAQISEGED